MMDLIKHQQSERRVQKVRASALTARCESSPQTEVGTVKSLYSLFHTLTVKNSPNTSTELCKQTVAFLMLVI